MNVAADTRSDAVAQLSEFIGNLRGMRSLKICGKRPLFAKNYLYGWRYALHRTSIAAARLVAPFGQFPIIEPIPPSQKVPVVVWKSIESTGRAGLIAETIPEGGLIYLIRHPCGFVDSVLRGERGERFSSATSAADDWGMFRLLCDTEPARRQGVTLEYLETLSAEARLAWRWALWNEKAMAELSKCANARLLRYEDLCAAPLQTAKKLFEFVGLRWDPAVESFIRNSTARTEDRYYSVFRDPQKAALAWRDHLTEQQVEEIMEVARGSSVGQMFLQSDPPDSGNDVLAKQRESPVDGDAPGRFE